MALKTKQNRNKKPRHAPRKNINRDRLVFPQRAGNSTDTQTQCNTTSVYPTATVPHMHSLGTARTNCYFHGTFPWNISFKDASVFQRCDQMVDLLKLAENSEQNEQLLVCICWQSQGGSFIPTEERGANLPVALWVPKPASVLCPLPASLSSASYSGGSIFLPTFLRAISSALNNLLSLLAWPSPGPPLGLSLSITSQMQSHRPVRGFHGTRHLQCTYHSL